MRKPVNAAQGAKSGDSPRDELVNHLPALRAFALSLTREGASADDLVQDTIVKAWTNMDKFQPGTNLRAWLFTILRNTFYSARRKTKREVSDADGIHAARLATRPEHDGRLALIHFQQRPVAELHHPKKYGFIVTNPPYGERLEDKADLPELYSQIGETYRRLDAWSMYLITSYEDTERYIGRKADKNRKIYNGMLKTYFYQFMGPKPPKRDNFH